MQEVIACLKAIFRRVESLEKRFFGATETIAVGPLRIDTNGREVLLDGEPMALTARELDLLVQFVHHPACVFSSTQLLARLAGFSLHAATVCEAHQRSG